MKKAHENIAGFTLTELLVAMAVFIVVTTVAVGAFIQSLKSERHVVTMLSISNDVSAAIEQMAREIRTGYNFSANGSTIDFTDVQGNSVSYGLSANRVVQGSTPITSSNTVVKTLDFTVAQDGGDVCNPWRVTILLGIGAQGADPGVPPVYIQTTVSSRTLPQNVPFDQRLPQYSGCY